jgi:hypothetical protein
MVVSYFNGWVGGAGKSIGGSVRSEPMPSSRAASRAFTQSG